MQYISGEPLFADIIDAVVVDIRDVPDARDVINAAIHVQAKKPNESRVWFTACSSYMCYTGHRVCKLS